MILSTCNRTIVVNTNVQFIIRDCKLKVEIHVVVNEW